MVTAKSKKGFAGMKKVSTFAPLRKGGTVVREWKKGVFGAIGLENDWIQKGKIFKIIFK
ncbi:hypothetical protein [Sphingobacterium corticis]|uniref:hypothetical protein n=1 Tax=Sphingobacterium corticis TaxID=1812823 RepID=UPI0036D28D64